MLLVLVLGGGLDWVVRRAHVQRDAVATIERAGGHVVYEWARSDREYPPGARLEPSWPRWLVRWLGPDYFGDVVEVYIGYANRAYAPHPDRLDDALLAQVARLKNLEVFWIHGGYVAPVTDAGLEVLAEFPRLKRVEFSSLRPGIRGKFLRHLGTMLHLRSLDLNQVSVPDDVLATIARLPPMDHMRLVNLRVESEAGIAGLLRKFPHGGITWKLETPGP
jgi:hypothetical protein